MSEIPVMKCPECGATMEYQGGPSDSNIFIMICPREECRYQRTCYAEATAQSHFLTKEMYECMVQPRDYSLNVPGIPPAEKP